MAEVARFVAQAERRAHPDGRSPRSRWRSRPSCCGLGFEFVDTPGVGSAIAANTAATLRYLPQADAVVFVTGFDSALTGTETDFLTTGGRTVRESCSWSSTSATWSPSATLRR